VFVSERIKGEGERDVYLYDRKEGKLLPTPGLNSKAEDFDPCVVVVDGKVVDEFSGALPESAVRSFLARIVPSEAEKRRRSAKEAIAAGDVPAAEAALKDALALEPRSTGARLDLVELYIDSGRFEDAGEVLDHIPERERDARADQLAGRIAFWRRSRTLESAGVLEAALVRAPDDQAVRLRLAERHMADGQLEHALERLLEVVRADRGALREQARRTMVEVFGMAAGNPELVSRYRRMLAGALY
jgi:putative thioredoxin